MEKYGEGRTEGTEDEGGVWVEMEGEEAEVFVEESRGEEDEEKEYDGG